MQPFRFCSWQSGALLGLGTAAVLALLFTSGQKPRFLPGRTSDGHHQIEAACAACHTPFRGVENTACVGCHGAELEAVKDSHGLDKFRDPRTLDMLSAIDATRCVTCHREHLPQITSSMSVTVPADFCHQCHADIATERPSHKTFSASGCATTGCHRYHDNTALYEDFLASHLDEPATKSGAKRPLKELGTFFAAKTPASKQNLKAEEHDGKLGLAKDSKLVLEWAASSHARGGVNCGDCHRRAGGAWTDQPGIKACARCHAPEADGFLDGRHGMRLEQGLPAMSPREARLPMKKQNQLRELGCGSCHAAHAFDTRGAAVAACLSCHDDEHTRRYEGSPHHLLWQKELRGELPAGSGVSCATCHLPRKTIKEHGRQRTAVEHNQNNNLRPDDKFVRSVCLDCHGLFFALNALADDKNVRQNFRRPPLPLLETDDLVRRRAGSEP